MLSRKAIGVLTSAVAVALSTHSATAASTWIGPAGSTASPTTGNWNTAGNWSPSGVPASGSTQDLIFGGNTTYTATQNVGGNYNFRTITLNSTAVGGDTIGGTNNFQPSNGTIQQNNTGAFTISTPFGGANSAALLNLAGNGTGIVTITGALTEQNSTSHNLTLTKSGSSTFVLSPGSSSAFSGGIAITGGTLVGTTTTSFGGGVIALNGGTLAAAVNSGVTFADNVTVGASSSVSSDRTSAGAGVTHTFGTLSIGAFTLSITPGANVTSGTAGVTFGATTLTGNATFDTANASNLTLGALSGNFTFTKQGAGSMTLNTASTRTFGSTINAGTLVVGNATALGSGSITIGSGTLNVTTVSATVGAATLNGGNVTGSTGTLALGGNLVSTGTSQIASRVSLGATRNFNVTNQLTVSNVISGTGFGINKQGAGELVLSGANSYTGLTDIQSGQVTLKSSGNIAGSIHVGGGNTLDVTDFGATGFNVAANATLSGTGTVSGKVNLPTSATIAPGDIGSAPGALVTGDEDWGGGGKYTWEIKDATGAAGSGFDQLQLPAGALSVSATNGNKFTIDITSLNASNANGNAANFVKTNNYDWVIATTNGPVTIDPNAFTLADHFTNDTTATNAPGATDGQFSISGSGNDVILHYSAAPEPAALSLLILSTAGLLARRRRRETQPA